MDIGASGIHPFFAPSFTEYENMSLVAITSATCQWGLAPPPRQNLKPPKTFLLEKIRHNAHIFSMKRHIFIDYWSSQCPHF